MVLARKMSEIVQFSTNSVINFRFWCDRNRRAKKSARNNAVGYPLFPLWQVGDVASRSPLQLWSTYVAVKKKPTTSQCVHNTMASRDRDQHLYCERAYVNHEQSSDLCTTPRAQNS
jgi:hypothetical protein